VIAGYTCRENHLLLYLLLAPGSGGRREEGEGRLVVLVVKRE